MDERKHRTKLKPFQKEGVRLIEKYHGRALLADDMGLGKTIQALTWIRRHPKMRPVVVVCPAFVKWVWKNQSWEHIHMRATVLSGQTPSKKGLKVQHDLIIVNYDILQYWIEYLKEQEPQAIIIDEAHFIKSMTAIRTRKVAELCDGVRHILAIGGTPLTNKPVDLFPTLHILKPKRFSNFPAFAHTYSHPRHRRWGWDFSRPANLKRLHRILTKRLMIRRLKKDVLKELPDKERIVIPVDIEHRRDYVHAEQDFLDWLRSKSAAKAAKARKAKELVKLGYLKRLAAELKMKAVCEWIDNFLESSDEKLVLFTWHKKIMKRLRKRYSKICVHIDGSVSPRLRKDAIRSFQHKRGKRILIGQITSIGTGTDKMQTSCSTGLFVELDWVPANHTQAEDRLHRIGQSKKVVIYYLVAKDTIEEKLCKVLQEKQTTLNKVLDGNAEVQRSKLNIYDQIIRKLQKGRR